MKEVIQHLNNSEKPLAMYYFGNVTNNPNKERFENDVQAGMMCVNDVLIMGINPDLPFGGVGYSGQGSYGGIDGFRNFSNSKGVMIKPIINLKMVNELVMPPYSAGDQKLLRMLMGRPMYQSQVQKFLLIVLLFIVLLVVYKMGYLF